MKAGFQKLKLHTAEAGGVFARKTRRGLQLESPLDSRTQTEVCAI
jgi:hypothetical protein